MTDYQMRDTTTGQFSGATLTEITYAEFGATPEEIEKALRLMESGAVNRLLGRA